MSHTLVNPVSIAPIGDRGSDFIVKGCILSYPDIWNCTTYKGKKMAGRFAQKLLFPLAQNEAVKKIHATMIQFAKDNDRAVRGLKDLDDVKFGRPVDKKGTLKDELKDWYELRLSSTYMAQYNFAINRASR